MKVYLCICSRHYSHHEEYEVPEEFLHEEKPWSYVSFRTDENIEKGQDKYHNHQNDENWKIVHQNRKEAEKDLPDPSGRFEAETIERGMQRKEYKKTIK